MAGNETTQGLTVIISLKDQLSSAMNGVQKRLESAFSTIQAAATKAFLVLKAGFVMMAREAIKSADQLDKLSKQTGINVMNLQKLGLAAQASGASMGQVSQALKMLSRDALAASQGSAESIRKFQEMGMSIYDMNGNLKTAEQLFADFSDVIATTANPTERMAIATKMLGRSGAELIPMLEKGSHGLKAFGDQAERFGFLMSGETVEALDKFGDQLEMTKTIFVNMIGTFLANSGITVPKIIHYFLLLSKTLVEVGYGLRAQFEMWVSLGKYLWKGLSTWFGALVESGKIAFAKLAGTIEPFVTAVTHLLTGLKIMTTKTADDIRNSMINMGAEAAKKGILDPFSEAYQKSGEAFDQMIENNKAQNALLARDLAGNLQDIDDFEKNIVATITAEDPLKSNTKPLPGGIGERRDINAMEKSIRGGLILAIEDLTTVTINYKERWTELFSTMKDGFSDAISRMIVEGKSLKDSMKALFKDIKYQFVKMITDMIMNQVFKQFATTIASLIPGFQLAGGGGSGGAMAGSAAAAVARTGVSTPGGGSTPTGTSGIPSSVNIQNQAAAGAGVSAFSFGDLGPTGNAALGIGAGIGTAAGGYVMNRGVEQGNTTLGVAGGALMGASMGAIFGPVGMVVGALAGAALGYFSSNDAKKEEEKMKERQRAAEEEARRQHEAMVEKAKGLIKMHVRNNMGGGLATEEAMRDVSGLFSGDISAEEVESFGAENVVSRQGEIERQSSVDVGGVTISVNANVSGQYDVQRLAEDLGYHMARTLRSAAAGATS